jgi:hypothetical protein
MLYQLVQWPCSQVFMDAVWFDEECSLADFNKFGSSAYFIPIDRIREQEDIDLYNEIEKQKQDSELPNWLTT